VKSAHDNPREFRKQMSELEFEILELSAMSSEIEHRTRMHLKHYGPALFAGGDSLIKANGEKRDLQRLRKRFARGLSRIDRKRAQLETKLAKLTSGGRK
jgi:hypothetical protein